MTINVKVVKLLITNKMSRWHLRFNTTIVQSVIPTPADCERALRSFLIHTDAVPLNVIMHGGRGLGTFFFNSVCFGSVFFCSHKQRIMAQCFCVCQNLYCRLHSPRTNWGCQSAADNTYDISKTNVEFSQVKLGDNQMLMNRLSKEINHFICRLQLHIEIGVICTQLDHTYSYQ